MSNTKNFLSMIATSLFTCSLLVMTGCQSSSNPVGEEESILSYEESKGKERGGWINFDQNPELAECRDIAAYEDVAVITKDGKSIWWKSGSASAFSKINLEANSQAILNSDPAVSIEMGKKKSYSPAPRVGIYEDVAFVATTSGALYQVMMVSNGSTRWHLVRENEGGPLVTDDFCVTHDNRIFVVDNGNLHEKIEVSGTWASKGYIGDNVVSISYRVEGTSTPHLFKLLCLTSDNKAYKLQYDNYWQKLFKYEVSIDGLTPSKDIEASQADYISGTNCKAYATFDNNSSTVKYRTNDGIQSVGIARKIAIDKNNVLWDAYTRSIYKKQL